MIPKIKLFSRNTSSPLRLAPRVVLACAALCAGATAGFATDGQWNYNGSSGVWSATARWLDNNIANGAGAHADFSNAGVTSNSARAITLDMSVTLGRFTFGSPTGDEKAAWRLSVSGTNSLTFDNNGATASLVVGPGNSSNNNVQLISVPIYLADSLNIKAEAPVGFTVSISGAISASTTGTKIITNNGAGPFAVNLNSVISDGAGVVAVVQDSTKSNLNIGGSNSYTGGTIIKAGVLSIGADNRLGAADGIVVFSGGTLSFTSSATNVVSNRATMFDAPNATFLLSSAANVIWNGSINGSGTLNKTGSGTLALTGTNNFGGVLIADGVLKATTDSMKGAVVNNATLTIDQAYNGAYDGAISGTGKFNKTGAGIVALKANSLSQTSTISITAGGLLLDAPGSNLAGDVVVSNALFGAAGTVGASAANKLTMTNATLRVGLDGAPVTGAQTLTVTGALDITNTKLQFDLFGGAVSDRLNAGTLVNGGGNSIQIGLFKSGTFNLGANLGALWNSGTLFVDGIAYQSGGRRTVTLSDNAGALQLVATTSANIDYTWSGSSGSAWDAATANWNGAGDGKFIYGDAVTFNDSVANAASRAVTVGSSGVVVSSMTVAGTGDYTFTGGGIIADKNSAEGPLAATASGKLTKTSTGKLTLNNGANNFAGGVDLFAGTLALGANVTLGSGTIAIKGAGVTIEAGGALSLATGMDLSANGVTLATQGNNVAISGIIGGANKITKTGAGTLLLRGANTHGGVNFDSGAVVAGHASAFGAALQINGANSIVGIDTSGTIATAINFGAFGATIDVSEISNAAISGLLSGNGAITKTGRGAVTLLGNNTAFSGSMMIDEGTLNVASEGSLGTSAEAVAIGSRGTLGYVQNAAADHTFAHAISGNGIFAVSMGARDNLFRFGAGVTTAFSGTVSVLRGTVRMDVSALPDYANAGLSIKSAGLLEIASSGTISSLEIDGGTIRISLDDGMPQNMLSVGSLSVKSGTIAANVPPASSSDIVNPPIPPNPGIFDLAGATGTQLLAADNVDGVGALLTVVQIDGTPLPSGVSADVKQAGVAVAKAYYNYVGSVADDGVYLTFGITELDILAGNVLILDDTGASRSTLAAKLTGTGGIDVRTHGMVTLANSANDFIGSTTISTGTLRLAAAGSLRTSAAVHIAAGAALDAGTQSQTVRNLTGDGAIILSTNALTIDTPTDTTYSGSIRGGMNGSIVKTGTATLTLGGVNTQLHTRITDGRLIATRIEALGSGSTTVSSTAVLEFKNVSGSLNRPVAGGGTLDLIGSNISLGGANVFKQVNIDGASRLAITGSNGLGGSAANVHVAPGARLEAVAASVFANNIIVDNATLVIGASAGKVGSLKLTGTLGFNNGSRLAASGDVSAGIHEIVDAAGGISGTPLFDSIQNGLFMNLASDGNKMTLTALNQAAGPAKEIALASETIIAIHDAATLHLNDELLAPAAARDAHGDTRNDFWLNGVFAKARYDRTIGLVGQDINVSGVLAGYDRRIRRGSALLGVYGGAATSTSDTDNNAHANTDTVIAGVHGAVRLGIFYIGADASYGWMETLSKKHEGTTTTKANTDADYQSASLEGGLIWNLAERTVIRPSVSVYAMRVNYDESVENGPGAMRTDAFDYRSTQALASVRGTQRFTLPWKWKCAFDVACGWRFDLSTDTPEVGARFIADPGGHVFMLKTAGYDRNTGLLSAGLRMAIRPEVVAGLSYAYEGGSGVSRQSWNASILWLW